MMLIPATFRELIASRQRIIRDAGLSRWIPGLGGDRVKTSADRRQAILIELQFFAYADCG
jgi:hypothetical protein